MAVSFTPKRDLYVGPSGLSTHKWKVKSGAAATIAEGDIVIKDGSNAGYAKIAANGSSNTSTYLGIAASASTDTASADGEVLVTSAMNLVFEGKVTTVANLGRTRVLTRVTLDGTTGAQNIDEDDTTAGVIWILDPLDFKVSDSFDTTDGVHQFMLQCHLVNL